MENEELVIRIQAGENVSENMELLYSQIQSYIWSIAWRYRDTGEMEDLMQEGYLALYPAIENYDPAAGCKFLTYASRWSDRECSVICRITAVVCAFLCSAWNRSGR